VRLRRVGRPVDGEPLASLERLWQDWTAPTMNSVAFVVATALEQHHVQQYWSRGGGEGPRERTEAELCQRYLAHLASTGIEAYRHCISTIAGPVLWTDLYDPHRDELIEAKRDTSRNAIRLAIGQLYDYRRYLDSATSTGLAVLLPARPCVDLLELLSSVSITVIWPNDTASFTRG
jgi:hypothetical protein